VRTYPDKLTLDLGSTTMSDLLGKTLFPVSHKFTNYWQALLRFGLPSTVLFNLIDYLRFRAGATTNSAVQFDWGLTISLSVPVMFIVSAIWCLLMRRIASGRNG